MDRNIKKENNKTFKIERVLETLILTNIAINICPFFATSQQSPGVVCSATFIVYHSKYVFCHCYSNN